MFAIACDNQALIAAVQARLSSLLARFGPTSLGGILSITLPLPPGCKPDLSRLPLDSVFWARGGTGSFRVGSGSAVSYHGRGAERFATLHRGMDDLRRRWICLDPDNTGFRAQAFLGLPFSAGTGLGEDWLHAGDARLTLPLLLYRHKGPIGSLTFSHPLKSVGDSGRILELWLDQLAALTQGTEPAGDVEPLDNPTRSSDPLVRLQQTPSPEEWLQRVSRAVSDIHRGRMEKLVLTRRIQVRRDRPIRPEQLLDWLGTHYPTCTQIAITGRRGTLVASSPERLVSLRGDRLVSDAVAGTAPRGESDSADRHLGGTLQASRKTQREHRLVVDEVLQALAPLCSGVSAPSQPMLMKLPRVQHLWSPVHARARPGVSLLQLAERLHPTSAVGGIPRAEALAWLAQHEPEPRGWYTGALGWVDAGGDGDLCIILRCALIQGQQARLFAGSGIVAQSNPEEELRETEWKLQTMLDGLDAA